MAKRLVVFENALRSQPRRIWPATALGSTREQRWQRSPVHACHLHQLSTKPVQVPVPLTVPVPVPVAVRVQSHVSSAPLVLGVETSCDDTAASVCSLDGRVLSDVRRSQTALTTDLGGVLLFVAHSAFAYNVYELRSHRWAQGG